MTCMLTVPAGGVVQQSALGQVWSAEHEEAWLSVFGVIGIAARQVKMPGLAAAAASSEE